MTARNEAISIISELPDAYVENVLGILRNLKSMYKKTKLEDAEVKISGDFDFSQYGHRTERGQFVDEYMKEMRDGDRL